MTKLALIAAFGIVGSATLFSILSCVENNPAAKTTETAITAAPAAKPLLTGADQTALYLPLLKGKRVGIVGNQTSIIGKKSSVDSLLKLGIKIVTLFGPEHGFRGNASNGAAVGDEVDSATGIPIISLYGKNRKPSKEQLDKIDVLIFDMQDVGCRFYTNINTLATIMEACSEAGKELLLLDRPNPNAYFVDGPILEDHLRSGIGRFRIPITHGLTLAEFAQMLNGEGWLANKEQCKLRIIKCANYTHETPYAPPVNPSPNLNTTQSILLYPTLCMFEGTIISQGRGTYMPFAVLGAPLLKDKYTFSFTPQSLKGMSETPLHQDTACYGLDLRKYDVNILRKERRIHLQWMIELYKAYPLKDKFFDRSQSRQIGSIDGLAGTGEFKKQIMAGMSEEDIRKSWEPGLSQYKEMRKKYLIYP